MAMGRMLLEDLLVGRVEEDLTICWMRALRCTLSKEKPPEGRLVSIPMSGLVNSDMVALDEGLRTDETIIDGRLKRVNVGDRSSFIDGNGDCPNKG